MCECEFTQQIVPSLMPHDHRIDSTKDIDEAYSQSPLRTHIKDLRLTVHFCCNASPCVCFVSSTSELVGDFKILMYLRDNWVRDRRFSCYYAFKSDILIALLEVKFRKFSLVLKT